MKRAGVVAAALVATMLAASGCGGSSDSSKSSSKSSTHAESIASSSTIALPPSKPLTRAQLIAKADAICSRVNAKFASYASAKLPNGENLLSAKGLAEATPQLVSAEQSALAELHKLTPPAELTSAWKQMLSGAQTIAVGTTRVGEYAKANNLGGATSVLQSVADAERQAYAAAKEAGLVDCTHHV
jgi:hypothetical protein